MTKFSTNLLLITSISLSSFSLPGFRWIRGSYSNNTKTRTKPSICPLSVSSLDTDDILARQIEEAKDLQMFVPGLRFGGNIGEGDGSFEIRGMTNGATSGTSDAGVVFT